MSSRLRPRFRFRKLETWLLEFGLLGEMKPGQFACIDTLPEDLAKIILQDFELHGPEYSIGL
jgi:hypothetical protein